MSSRSVVLNLMVQLVHVKCHCHQHTLGQHIIFAAVRVSSEIHIFLDDGKGSFYLNAAIHSQLNTTITDQPFQAGFTKLFFLLRYLKNFVSFLHWRLAVVAFYAARLVWTTFAAATCVDGRFQHIAVGTLGMTCVRGD